MEVRYGAVEIQKFDFFTSMRNIAYIGIIITGILLSGCGMTAKKATKTGHKKYERGEYEHAIEYYNIALSKGASRKDLNFLVAESYRKSNRIQQSLPYYQNSIEAFQNYVQTGNNFDFLNRAREELKHLDEISDIANKKTYYLVKNMG